MRRTRKLALAIAALAVAAQAAAQAPQRCVTRDEVRALGLVLLPDLLAAASTSCKASLPEGALLTRPDAPIYARYRAEVAAHTDQARAVLTRIAPPELAPLLEGPQGLQLAIGFVTPLVTKEIKPTDCPLLNSIVEDMEPLPPRNLASLLATGLEQIDRDQVKKGVKRDVPFCQAGAAR